MTGLGLAQARRSSPRWWSGWAGPLGEPSSSGDVEIETGETQSGSARSARSFAPLNSPGTTVPTNINDNFAMFNYVEGAGGSERPCPRLTNKRLSGPRPAVAFVGAVFWAV